MPSGAPTSSLQCVFLGLRSRYPARSYASGVLRTCAAKTLSFPCPFRSPPRSTFLEPFPLVPSPFRLPLLLYVILIMLSSVVSCPHTYTVERTPLFPSRCLYSYRSASSPHCASGTSPRLQHARPGHVYPYPYPSRTVPYQVSL